MKSNQEIEQYYFDMFRRDYSLPDGVIVHGDKPDVVVQGERTIGIEITNFFLEDGALPQSEQIQRRAREAVVSKAQEIYRSKRERRVEIWFSFDKASPIRDQSKVATRIAELAMRIDGQKTGIIWKDEFEDIPELSLVYLNAIEYEAPKWHVSQVYSGQIMSIDQLKEIVIAKELQSKSYQLCDAYWLLVVVDFLDPAQDQEIQIDVCEKINSNIFEKVFVYKTHFGQVLEVK